MNGDESYLNYKERVFLGDMPDAIMAMEFPPIEQVCGPVTTSQVLMVAGEAGIGKSLWSLDLAAHIAMGARFGDLEGDAWETPKRRKVLYVDGELPGAIIQQRLQLVPISQKKDHFRLMFQSHANLASIVWQDLFLERCDQFDVIVFDTVSSLIQPSDTCGPFSPEYWLQVTPFNDVLANLGKTVIWVDHLNKEGKVFGTNVKHHKVSDLWLLKKNPVHETGFSIEPMKGRNAPSRVISDWHFSVVDGWSMTHGKEQTEATEDQAAGAASGREDYFRRKYG